MRSPRFARTSPWRRAAWPIAREGSAVVVIAKLAPSRAGRGSFAAPFKAHLERDELLDRQRFQRAQPQ